MTNSLLRAGALSCALLATTALTTPAVAQTSPPPRFQEVDPNGVDLISGRFVFRLTEGVIGSGDGAVTLERGQRNDYGRTDQWSGLLYHRTSGGTTLVYVQFGDRTETFTISGSTYTSTLANGGTLTGGAGGYTYTAPDGTTVTYITSGPDLGYPLSGPGCSFGDPGTCAIPVSVARPNGMSFALDWEIVERCHEYDEELNCLSPAAYFRFDGVTSGTGYSFSFNYASDSPGFPQQGAPPPEWFQRTGATFTNNVTAPPTNPTVTYATVSGAEEITDTAGRVWRITSGTSGITGIRRPGSTSDDITVSYGTGGVVSSVVRDGVTTTYSRSVTGTTATTTITQVDGDAGTTDPQTVVVADLSKERVTSVTDPLGHATSFAYDANSRLTRVTQPENNYVEFTYDARGNVTETRRRNKASNASNDVVATAAFPSTCTNPVTCNRPTSTTDANGNTTDYSWDSTHGGLLTVTPPAPTTGATRPQTRFSYTLTNGEHRLTGISACQAGTAPVCVGTADEARTVIGYDSQGNVTSVERRNGSGTISSTSTATWDAYGNLATVDGPLSGTADTTRLRYNAANQVVGVIGPDPDGAGALKHRAVRTTYRSDGLPTKIERGTVNSQSDSDWNAFATLEEVQQEYDSNDRPTVQRLVSGSTAHALTQTSYDGLGRLRCVAQRMNPNEFASAALPADACTLDTEGSFGSDRIARTSYDLAGRVTKVETGVGVTGVAADEVTTAYTNNGQVQHVTDPEGNRTTYLYDGHDRLQTIRYPHPTIDGQSSSSDAEQVSRDANGNVTQVILRDGQTIALGYDQLNRLISRNLPGSELDVTYGYDLLGRLTSASTSAQTLSFTFDALGRNLTQVGPHGTATSTWDAAGRRTRLTYPGGFYVDYDHLLTGEITAIREYGATSGIGVLGSYAYDDLGRRTSLTRGNGAVTSYSYDPVSRMDELVQNLVGTTSDLTLTFSHNPASQIVSNVRSNDNYAFTGLANQNVSDTHNGLNQITATGGTSVSHDGRGNISAIGTSSYGYSSENLLTSAPGPTTLTYDPLHRLYETVGGGPTARFAYDGWTIITEYNATNGIRRRYVHGSGIDEPLVSYEGSGTSVPHWYHADERGSIVAISDSTGAVEAVNRYDEYGQPQAAPPERFGYTGQPWLPGVNLWYYRARMYNPSLGRFMQSDPSGYGGGMNLYAYVWNDPVNFIDPLGLESCRAGDTSPGAEDCDEIIVIGLRRGALTRLASLVGILPRGVSENGGRGDAPRECTSLEEALQETGEFVTNVGGSVTDVGISVSVIGGGIAATGAVTGNVPMAAFGTAVIGQGGRYIAGGGAIALAGGVMQAAGGRPSEAISSHVADRMTRNLPLPEAARTWVSDQVGSGVEAALGSVFNTCR